jgi:thymidylate synthase ThyX
MPEPQPPAESFTAEEAALLAPYVTNTDRSVFALTNLPEVIKGALFSRYSRSTLGLRRLLLKEFIQAPEAGFAGIAGAQQGAAAGEAHLAVARAQDFYDRILDGYGDDSIGELGGAHLAIENVSMIAAKAIEDARIGGSPLEKSTRYVSFGQKAGGDYLYYQEPRLMASAHRERYLGACRMLFETYIALMEPVRAHIAAQNSDAARAKTFDALRGLLPAGTVTNMGVYGNGRFFESLLVKLHLSELAELREIAQSAHGELAKVIPSFIRRGRTDHPHFAGFRAHDQIQSKIAGYVAGAAEANSAARAREPEPSVRLVDHDPEAETKILAALAYPGTDRDLPSLRKWAHGLSDTERATWLNGIADARQNRRHKPPRAFELAYYTFDLLGDFGMYRDLHRHRMLTQQRQPLSTRHGYALPPEVEQAGQAPRYREAMERAAQAYEAIAAEFPAEAQYVVPMAYRIRWSMTVNLRSLIWLVELRSAPQGHPAYRKMAQELYHAVESVHPRLAPLFAFVDMQGSRGGRTPGRLEAERRKLEKTQMELQWGRPSR